MDSVVSKFDVAVDIRCDEWSTELAAPADLCRRAAAAAFASADVSPEGVEISVVLADDVFVQTLNRQWRDTDAPTNVLAFPGAEQSGDDDAVWLLGDVVVALETTRRESDMESKTFDHHLTHLIVHGVLHLLGYDHNSDAEAEKMEKLEILALGRLGIDDPYRGHITDAQHLS